MAICDAGRITELARREFSKSSPPSFRPDSFAIWKLHILSRWEGGILDHPNAQNLFDRSEQLPGLGLLYQNRGAPLPAHLIDGGRLNQHANQHAAQC
jgi:hypothetical protein